VDTDATKHEDPDDRVKRSPGRRTIDHVKSKGWWVLLVGALLQGGFIAFSHNLMSMGERQLDRERAMLVSQHTEMVARIADQSLEISKLTFRIGDLESEVSSFKSLAAGTFHCPVCPHCPACPPPSFVLTPGTSVSIPEKAPPDQARPVPSSKPPPPPPSSNRRER
jgi:hypothetical protein